MEKIYNNLSTENLIKTDWFNQFNRNQKCEILIGLEHNLNVSIYAKKEIKGYQMREIRYGLEKNLDISVYLNNKFKWEQMKEIREGLERNLDVSIYTKLKYNSCKMREIRERLLKEKKDEEYFKGLKNE